MPSWVVEFCVILLLALLNGFFAAAEIAILTARRGRLEQWANDGDSASLVALNLAKDADRFLPTVQVGITLVGTFASAFAGARLQIPLQTLFASAPLSWARDHSEGLAITAVVCGVSFLQLILGELVPKRIAFQNAEPLARFVAYPMMFLQRGSRPVIWFLQATTRLVLRVLGQQVDQQPTVSVEDIQHLISAGTEAGLLEESEQKVAMEALRLGDRTVSEILRPRIDIDALDLDTPSSEVVGALAMSGFSRIPVCEGTIDHIVGFVYLKDVFLQQYLGRPIDLRRMIRKPLFIPKSITITRLLELFRQHKTQLAIVLDEYGGTQGMVTLEDVLEMLVGDIHDEHRHGRDGDDHDPDIVVREDGSLSVDGLSNLHELEKALDVSRWSEPVPRGVGTVSGLVLGLLKRPPKIGDVMEWNDLRIEIVDMDGPKIDRLLIQQLNEKKDAEKKDSEKESDETESKMGE
ncbi:hemolysin family protein [Schlesneria paludicola]|uniref:hemolysin family protein n=1 Tax=Schlesneria paludicola TaxID=360056 RepID=UPI00031FA901|nr:hemolysin family protein [Schlesneria paludicola]